MQRGGVGYGRAPFAQAARRPWSTGRTAGEVLHSHIRNGSWALAATSVLQEGTGSMAACSSSPSYLLPPTPPPPGGGEQAVGPGGGRAVYSRLLAHCPPPLIPAPANNSGFVLLTPHLTHVSRGRVLL